VQSLQQILSNQSQMFGGLPAHASSENIGFVGEFVKAAPMKAVPVKAVRLSEKKVQESASEESEDSVAEVIVETIPKKSTRVRNQNHGSSSRK